MDLREEHQQNPVADKVAALVAVTRPIIAGVMQSIRNEVLEDTNLNRAEVPLRLLGRLRKEGDGDCGIAFEYAVHDAILTQNPIVQDRVATALNQCRIFRGDPASILFAIEKKGAQQLISTQLDLITDNSRVLSGKQGQPVKLKKQLNTLAAAFRRKSTRLNLPQSINGLWKADLFLGSTEPDHWVGTTVKINPAQLEAARGLRIAIVPTQSGRSDAIRLDEQRNLVVCPMPHDASFMQVFYEGWRIVQVLCQTDFEMPKEVQLPAPQDREVARIYVERRAYPVQDVLDAVRPFAQPELLVPKKELVTAVPFDSQADAETLTIVSPFPSIGRS
ncbi:hypothetical protein [Lentzea nigeriaca]|uniref:hypothetical protein n=1 Tax=Lentzea nigeriaca TaxID=1128665 RepID=UPI00195CB0A1|nr:hypothetical protein [Lentzea nigeriaca]MBM7861125.1 hypothetical protein [Lentzea nigeriaca]